MSIWTSTRTATAAICLAFAAIPGGIVVIHQSGVANADVPPPAYYAPMPYDPPPPPNVTGCVSYNGRWVNAGGCN
jgi:hypothetical protein